MPGHLRRRTLLAVIVLVALALRAQNLGWPPLWTDEAESAINALTIVAEGLPTDHHLGLPIYENTLVRPWPENAEYEFRDISYSDRGLAVYHGWIPLYAIAGAFRLAGVTPEMARRTTPPRDAGVDELAFWTAVPRYPALAFSVIFVLAAFALGRATGGDRTGFAFAFAGAVANGLVWWGRQARYYSATLAGNTLCGLLVWRAARRGRLSDHALAGLAIGLLFHVHALSAVTMALVYLAALPLALRQPRLWLRVLVAGGVGGIVVLPWAVWSGLIGHITYLPAARNYLDLAHLVATLPTTSPAVLGTAVVGVVWLVLAWGAGRAARGRLAASLSRRGAPLVLRARLARARLCRVRWARSRGELLYRTRAVGGGRARATAGRAGAHRGGTRSATVLARAADRRHGGDTGVCRTASAWTPGEAGRELRGIRAPHPRSGCRCRRPAARDPQRAPAAHLLLRAPGAERGTAASGVAREVRRAARDRRTRGLRGHSCGTGGRSGAAAGNDALARASARPRA